MEATLWPEAWVVEVESVTDEERPVALVVLQLSPLDWAMPVEWESVWLPESV